MLGGALLKDVGGHKNLGVGIVGSLKKQKPAKNMRRNGDTNIASSIGTG